MTLIADARGDAVSSSATERIARPAAPATQNRPSVLDDRPVEFWPTVAIRSALDTGDLTVWRRIVAAIKRDPYGRTARQVEEVLETAEPYGVSKALSEVLIRTRDHLEADECAEVARQVRALLGRSGLGQQEFASRIGVAPDVLGSYLEGDSCPAASLMIRMRRLSDRFAKMRAQRSGQSD
ncbi:MAG: hypothetical protein JWR37_2067 [Mycobacterium sp.]|nr:hypothetical protein [Mycobacterium sp.]